MVVGDTLLVVQKTFSRLDQTVITWCQHWAGNYRVQSQAGAAVRGLAPQWLRSQSSVGQKGVGAESDERKPRGSRGGRDDVLGGSGWRLLRPKAKVTQTSLLVVTPTTKAA